MNAPAGLPRLCPTDLPSRLRAETRAEHEAVEAVLGALTGPLTRDLYRTILERFYGFYEPWERQLEALLGAGFFEPRRKLPLLERDLCVLSRSAAIAPLPRAAPPPLRTRAEAMGSLYVGEGATLGGRLILRNVGERLGIYAASGGAFFASYGEAVGPMWRRMREKLAEVPASDHEAALKAARATFCSLRVWMSR